MLRKRVYPANMYDSLLTLINAEKEEWKSTDSKREWTTSTAEEYVKKMITSSRENVSHMIIT